jgi:hypothetical protein
VPDALNPVELLPKKALVVTGVGDRHLDQIVVFAGDEIGLDNFRDPCKGVAEPGEHLVVVFVQRDFDEDDILQADGDVVDDSRVMLDDADLLQAPDPRPARRR